MPPASRSYVILPGSANTGTQTGSWGVHYGIDQLLVVDPDNPRRGWGVFGNVGVSDGNPNPIHWFFNCGVAGISPLPGRSADSFGIGWYFVGVSEDLKQASASSFPLRDEQGGEIYYDVSVTPWFRLTADLQGINPALIAARPALLVGLRGKIIF